MKNFMEQQLWLAKSPLSLRYWKWGGPAKKNTLYIEILILNDDYDKTDNLEKDEDDDKNGHTMMMIKSCKGFLSQCSN